MRTNSACVPSMVLPRIQPPVVQWEYICLRQYSHLPQALTQEISTWSPALNAVTAGPTFSMMPTPSWPRIEPGLQVGTSPLRMCRSVPQMVVLVILTIASVGAVMSGFSNRPFGVKHFQTIHHYSVDVAHGLALLFGIGTGALPSCDSKTRWNNLWNGLAVRVTGGPSGHTNSPHPSSREGHHSTAWWSSGFLLSHLIRHGSHAVAASLVQRNSVPSTHMRRMITANRRASATIAFFTPRCLTIFIAQALSHDHLLVRVSMI